MKFNQFLRENNYVANKSWKKYGVIYKSHESYFYLCAVDKFKLKNCNEELLIKDGLFLKFEHTGSMYLLSNTFQKIYKEIIPKSNFSIDKNRNIIHYECYDNWFNWNAHNSIIEIFVPINNSTT